MWTRVAQMPVLDVCECWCVPRAVPQPHVSQTRSRGIFPKQSRSSRSCRTLSSGDSWSTAVDKKEEFVRQLIHHLRLAPQDRRMFGRVALAVACSIRSS